MIIPLLNIYQILSTISYIICCSQFSKSFCLCFALRFCFGPVSTPVIFLLSYCAHLFCVRSLICLPVVSEQLCKFLSCFCNVKSKSYLSFLTQSFPGFCPRLFFIFFWIMDYATLLLPEHWTLFFLYTILGLTRIKLYTLVSSLMHSHGTVVQSWLVYKLQDVSVICAENTICL